MAIKGLRLDGDELVRGLDQLLYEQVNGGVTVESALRLIGTRRDQLTQLWGAPIWGKLGARMVTSEAMQRLGKAWSEPADRSLECITGGIICGDYTGASQGIFLDPRISDDSSMIWFGLMRARLDSHGQVVTPASWIKWSFDVAEGRPQLVSLLVADVDVVVFHLRTPVYVLSELECAITRGMDWFEGQRRDLKQIRDQWRFERTVLGRCGVSGNTQIAI